MAPNADIAIELIRPLVEKSLNLEYQ